MSITIANSWNHKRLVLPVGLWIGMANVQAAIAQCPPQYSVEIFAGPDCPFLPSFAGAWGINDNGAIAGYYLDCGETAHLVIWSATGEVTELPPSDDPGYPTILFDINNLGQVAGKLWVPSLDPTPDRAFLYSDGVTLNLGALPGHNWAEAYAINESGVICGTSNNTATGPLTAFVWHDGEMSALPLTFGKFSSAHDVSDTGLVCGWMGDLSKLAHAFIHDLATGETIDVGVVLEGATASFARGVNNSGTICGWSGIPCGELCTVIKGFIWSDGVAQDLGFLPGATSARALAINDSNAVVGISGGNGFVWQNCLIHALDDLVPPELNLIIREAWDIN
ncbi:MAG: hypothetical protein L0Z53_02345, partial [Acidobacteriales bacterium]|nr:hypothetical protein [Terriglobales bacterium]